MKRKQVKKNTYTSRQIFIKKFMKNYNLTEYEAEKLFLFIFYGSFSINKSLKWEKNEEWNKVQNLISKFVEYGLKHSSNS